MGLDTREEYEFTSDWFSWNIEPWRRIFDNLGVPPSRVIEVGSYEGRSTVWIIENLLTRAGGSIVAIDAWAEGTEPDQREMGAVEDRFDRNIGIAKRRCPNVESQKRKGPSWLALSQLIESGLHSTFDFIYIDGNHQASDVLTDLVLGFRLRAYPLRPAPQLVVASMGGSVAEQTSNITAPRGHRDRFSAFSD